MSTTLEAPEIQETEQVTFVARSENQVLTRRKTTFVYDSNGERRVQSEEEWRDEQVAANLRRAQEDKEPVLYDESPWKVIFFQGQYQTSDPLIIDWLRKHKKLNYNGPSGFFEMEKPLAEQKPTEVEQLREVREALLHRDLDRAEIALEVEKETHNRPTVLREAAAAVESITELVAEAPGEANPSGSPPSPSAN